MSSPDLQPLVPHLDHVSLLEPAAAAGFDLTVHDDLFRLDQDLRLAAAADDVRGFQGLAEGEAGRDLRGVDQGSQLWDGSRIGMIRYKKSGSSPSDPSSSGPPGTISPGFKDSLSLKRTFSESTAETPSSR
jgi:hypothetical protein